MIAAPGKVSEVVGRIDRHPAPVGVVSGTVAGVMFVPSDAGVPVLGGVVSTTGAVPPVWSCTVEPGPVRR